MVVNYPCCTGGTSRFSAKEEPLEVFGEAKRTKPEARGRSRGRNAEGKPTEDGMPKVNPLCVEVKSNTNGMKPTKFKPTKTHLKDSFCRAETAGRSENAILIM